MNPTNRTVIALGFFDGVHRGHGALLQKAVERARELSATPAVFTFDRPPKEVVTGKPVFLINSLTTAGRSFTGSMVLTRSFLPPLTTP